MGVFRVDGIVVKATAAIRLRIAVLFTDILPFGPVSSTLAASDSAANCSLLFRCCNNRHVHRHRFV